MTVGRHRDGGQHDDCRAAIEAHRKIQAAMRGVPNDSLRHAHDSSQPYSSAAFTARQKVLRAMRSVQRYPPRDVCGAGYIYDHRPAHCQFEPNHGGPHGPHHHAAQH